MKTGTFFFSMLFAATVFAFFTNCTNQKTENGGGHDASEHASGSDAAAEATGPRFAVSPEFQSQLAAVFTSYIGLKEALVSSDAGEAREKAEKTNAALAEVNMKLLTGAPHNDWMAYLAPMQVSVNEIMAGDDVEAQRRSFSTLSDNLYKSVKAFGLGGKEAFHEYCPMAFNNEGAYWLSHEENIRNPYFGDKMLTCGQVKEKLM